MGDIFLIILEQTLLHVPLLCGAYISLSLMKVPDLSIESAYVCGALLSAKVLPLVGALPGMMGLVIVLGASLFGGALVGLTSSFITQFGRLPHLLSSIITFGIFYGIGQLIAGSYISLHTYPNLLEIDSIPHHPEIFMLAVICTVLAIALSLLFRRQMGYALAIYGNNPHFFAHYRISGPYIFISGIILANALAGLSGYLNAQSNGFADISMGFGKLLLSITALILGKSLLRNFKPPSLMIPLIGAAAYFCLQQVLIKSGFNLKYFSTLQACVVLFILIMLFRKQHKNIDHLGV
ncbi:MAG TPA: hypothetical protein VGP47_07445 [Parachlamydiaceae bacterium]|nr:hypothetical protein [Parachlamydiaceae bacterium]